MTLPEHEYSNAERKRREDEIWNDAIEAAAKIIELSWDDAIQGDLEHGVKSLNERAAFIFSRDYPLVSKLHGTANTILSLKRPVS